MKKVGIFSDFHCGHRVGLTPPGWMPDKPSHKRQKWYQVAREQYDWFEANLSGPYDVVLMNGDCIEGKGRRSGATELVTADRIEQTDMAIELLRRIPKKRGAPIVITRGTPSHTGDEEDYEDIVAMAMDAKIGEHEFVDIEGVIFNLKHHPAGGGQLPHTRASATSKDWLWNQIWADREMQPRCHVFIRSHVHFHSYCGGVDWLGMTTPALQGAGSKYGARRCNGVVDFGFVEFTVDNGCYEWEVRIAKMKKTKATVTKIL